MLFSEEIVSGNNLVKAQYLQTDIRRKEKGVVRTYLKLK